MSDSTLTCRDCGQEFVFTAGEQAFYQERGFSSPLRCPDCRRRRKSERNTGGYDSNDSYSSGGGGGGGYSSGGGGGGGYSSGPRQMYPAVCSNCGVDTEVPFEPRQDRPVYCRDCFQAQRGQQQPRY